MHVTRVTDVTHPITHVTHRQILKTNAQNRCICACFESLAHVTHITCACADLHPVRHVAQVTYLVEDIIHSRKLKFCIQNMKICLCFLIVCHYEHAQSKIHIISQADYCRRRKFKKKNRESSALCFDKEKT